MSCLRQHDNQMRNSLTGCQLQQQSKEMKYECTVHWDRETSELKIINRKLLVEQLQEQPTCYMDMTLEQEFSWKSDEQRGYLFAEVGPKALLGYRAQGINLKNKEMALDYLMLEPEIDCTNRIVNESTGELLARVPKSIASMSKAQTRDFMSSAITFIEVDLGVTVESPETWKERRLLKK